jgi:hypothetical protein
MQHLVVYLMYDHVPLANAAIAVYQDVQIDIETESHFANAALVQTKDARHTPDYRSNLGFQPLISLWYPVYPGITISRACSPIPLDIYSCPVSVSFASLSKVDRIKITTSSSNSGRFGPNEVCASPWLRN